MTSVIDMLLKKNRSGLASKGGAGRLVTFLNPHSYLFARQHRELFERFDDICFDGVVLAKSIKLLGGSGERISFDMTSLAPVVFSEAIKNGHDVFFVGSQVGVAQTAANEFRAKFKGLEVSGCRHGFFEDDDELNAFIRYLLELSPRIVVAGMGTPHQEKFLIALRDAGWQGDGYTCGGFLHQTVKGGIDYYPRFFDRYNLRWLYRMIDEPKLIKRYLISYSSFVAVFLVDFIRFKVSEKK